MSNKNKVFAGLLLILSIGVLSSNSGCSREKKTSLFPGAAYTHVHTETGGYGTEQSLKQLRYLKDLGFTHLNYMPFGYMEHVASTRIEGYDGLDGRGRKVNRWDPTLTSDKLLRDMKWAKEMGFSVMLKPHIWCGQFSKRSKDRKWRGDIQMRSDAGWQAWEENYRAFVLHYAKLAEQAGAEYFNLGLEYRLVVRHQSDFLKQLVEDVRKIYKGKVGYQANWDDYEEVSFWDKLDYIGVGAYFPLGDKVDASEEELVAHWKPRLKRLGKLAKQLDRPVIFTEVGYKSCKGTHLGHKNPVSPSESDLECQVKAYRALQKALGDQDFVKGFYVWKYFTDPDSYVKDEKQNDYYPYGKPAEDVFRNWFKKLNRTNK